jgi:hypothetical protein
VGAALTAAVDRVGRHYAPDSRDEVYEVSVARTGSRWVVHGSTTVAAAREELSAYISDFHPEVVDSLRLLPDETVGRGAYALANVSVADLRTGPDYAAEMATQLLLGTPMAVLEDSAGWWRVRTPEGYLAWVQGGTVVRMDGEAMNEWIIRKKVIFTADAGSAYETATEQGSRVSDLVFGNVLGGGGESVV